MTPYYVDSGRREKTLQEDLSPTTHFPGITTGLRARPYITWNAGSLECRWGGLGDSHHPCGHSWRNWVILFCILTATTVAETRSVLRMCWPKFHCLKLKLRREGAWSPPITLGCPEAPALSSHQKTTPSLPQLPWVSGGGRGKQ